MSTATTTRTTAPKRQHRAGQAQRLRREALEAANRPRTVATSAPIRHTATDAASIERGRLRAGWWLDEHGAALPERPTALDLARQRSRMASALAARGVPEDVRHAAWRAWLTESGNARHALACAAPWTQSPAEVAEWRAVDRALHGDHAPRATPATQAERLPKRPPASAAKVRNYGGGSA